MGIVLKQGFWNSVWTYFGMALGYFNLVVLYPNWMPKDEFGLTRLLLSFSIIVSQFAQLGAGKTIMKFFYEFSGGKKSQNLLLTFGSALSFIGVILAIGLLVITKGWIVDQYEEKSALFVDYYFFAFPLVAIITFFELYCLYLSTYLNSTLTSFLKECFFRVGQTVLLLFYYFKIIDLNNFVFGLIGIYVAMLLWVYASLILKYQFKFNFSLGSIKKKDYKVFLDYSFFVLLSTSSSAIAGQIDVLMIGAISENGLADIAIYTIGIYVSTVIHLPFRGANGIIMPLVGKAMQEERLSYVRNIYISSSVIFTALAGLVFVGIWCNMDNILVVLGEGYQEVVWVFFFLGMAKCYDMFTSINENIIVMSKYYRFSAYNLIILSVLTVLFNLFLIPIYGIAGAAFSTFIAIFISNTVKLIFIFIKFKMLPFSPKHFLSLIAIITTFLIGFFLPDLKGVFVDLIVRSLLIAATFSIIFVGLGVSEEFNTLLKKKFKELRGK